MNPNDNKEHKDVPQFACNAQILAASHKCIAFTCFRRSSYPVWVKELLFPPCNRYQPMPWMTHIEAREEDKLTFPDTRAHTLC